MPLIVLVGGARSGKSALAQQMAEGYGHGPILVATAEALDGEMAARVACHRAERGPEWTTVEEPRELAAAFDGCPSHAPLVVDCLTLWVSALIHDGLDDDAIAARSSGASDVARRRSGPTIVVTNEVGQGVVPATPLGRRFRDLQGRVNAEWVRRADRAFLVVAGAVVELAPATTAVPLAHG